LYQKERKYAKLFIFVSSILFFLGVIFGYFVLVLLSIIFLAIFTFSCILENKINIIYYLIFFKTSYLAPGLVFDLPFLIFFLFFLGLIFDSFYLFLCPSIF